MIFQILMAASTLAVLHGTAKKDLNAAGAPGAAGQPATGSKGSVRVNAQATNNPASSQAARIQNQNQPWYAGPNFQSEIPQLAGLFTQGANSIAGLFGDRSSDGVEEVTDMTDTGSDEVSSAFDDAGDFNSGSDFNDTDYSQDYSSDFSGGEDFSV